MDIDQKLSLTEETLATILITIVGAAVLFPTLWASEKIVRPLVKSDFGKTISLTCVRGRSSQVNCETYRLDLPSHDLSAKKFQLIDVSLNKYEGPENSSSHSLNLTTSAANIDITHGDFEKDESNYRKLKGLLTELRETSVSLKYQSGLVRVIIIWLINSLMLFGLFVGSGFILGCINTIFLTPKLLIQFIKFIGISSFMILSYFAKFFLDFLNSILKVIKLFIKFMRSIENR